MPDPITDNPASRTPDKTDDRRHIILYRKYGEGYQAWWRSCERQYGKTKDEAVRNAMIYTLRLFAAKMEQGEFVAFFERLFEEKETV